jgi:hypothetical protein
MFHIVIIMDESLNSHRILRRILNVWKIYAPLFVAITFFLVLVVSVFLNVEEKFFFVVGRGSDPIDTSDNVGFVSGMFCFSVCFRLWPDLDV